tara:strand:+ start:27 stop:563 length:537 start_codon:yes stop_codon:yes gene_type:complete
MKCIFKKVSFGLITFLLLLGFGLPKNIQKKIDKEVSAYFDIEIFTMELISIPNSSQLDLPSKFDGENLFRLFDGKSPIGYIYVDQAPSKTANFDYMVLLDNNFKILHSKVLIYREEYGGEIGSKRWLRQFNGKVPGNRVNHESNIDGIAGATISVRSMTNAIDNLLQSIAILKEQKAL